MKEMSAEMLAIFGFVLTIGHQCLCLRASRRQSQCLRVFHPQMLSPVGG